MVISIIRQTPSYYARILEHPSVQLYAHLFIKIYVFLFNASTNWAGKLFMAEDIHVGEYYKKIKESNRKISMKKPVFV